MSVKPGIKIRNYLDTFFCLEVDDACFCENKFNDHLICYIKSGKIQVSYNDRQYSVSEGQAFFIRRNHGVPRVTLPPENGDKFKGIIILFRYDSLKRKFSENRYFQSKKSVAQTSFPPFYILNSHPFLRGLFTSLDSFFENHQFPPESMLEPKMSEALITLIELNPTLSGVLFDFDEPWKVDLEEFMEKNYKVNLSITEFAHFTGRSLSTFKKDFRKIYGDITPGRWLIKRRLIEAKKLLETSGKKASEVYLDVGFKNLSHFSTAFKKEFGISPSSLTNP